VSEVKRYIIVGTGGFGGCWCRDFLPRLTELGKAVPVAAVDLNPEALQNAREHLGLSAAKCYADIDVAFAETPADFAVVVVPPAFHESVVDVALEHGLHILSEKPIADTMTASCRVYRKVNAAGVKMAVTMSHRFDQDKQSLERRIKSGEYGVLDYVIGRNTWTCRQYAAWGKFRYEIDNPLLIEGTVHHFDIMRSLAGADAKTVYARTWNPSWSEFKGDCQALITVEMINGVKVFYEGAKANASALNPWGQSFWRAECDLATLELDRRELRLIRGDSTVPDASVPLPLAEQQTWKNQWLAEMFVDWLAGGPPVPDPPPRNSAMAWISVPDKVTPFMVLTLTIAAAICAPVLPARVEPSSPWHPAQLARYKD